MKGSFIGILIALLSFQMSVALPVAAQNILSRKVDITLTNMSLERSFQELQQKTGIGIIYSSNGTLNKMVSINAQNESLKAVLDQLLAGTSLIYEVVGDNIVINTVRNVHKEEVKRSRAASITITGVVRDALGNPLVGVTIKVVGETRGTITDASGKYKIDVDPTDSLEFSYIGYQTQKIPVKNRVDIDVVMEAAKGSLNEVQIVGYGRQKKISVVGAQSTVDVAKLKLPVADLSTVLGGKLAGVVSVQRGGEPGYSGADVWIRGISTFSQGLSKPLVLVDGIPREYSDIDPEDIASFSVLKDAAATAVYGVRGANGVILITTKTGEEGKPKIRFRYNEGITSFTRLPKFADGPTYMRMSNEASETRGGNEIYSQEEIEKTANKTDPDLYPDVAWFDEIFRKIGHTRNANLNLSGGAPAAKYYVGLSYLDETGMYNQDSIQKYSSQARYKRYNLTSNLTLNVSKTTEVRLGVSGFLANVNGSHTGLGTVFNDAFALTPISIPAMYSNGKVPAEASSRMRNPYAELTQTGYYNQWRSRLTSNLRVTQRLDFWVKGLSISGKFGFDTYNYTSMHRAKVPDTYFASGRDADGNLILQLTNPGQGTEFLQYSATRHGDRTLYNEAKLDYKNSFGKHDVTGMILFNQSDKLDNQATDFITSLPYRFRGVSGRGTYGYDNRYFVELSFGYNGSENFSPANRYGFFPSAGAGWAISQEKFFEPLKNAIQLLKIRGSYGKVGNSEIDGRRFAYIATVGNGKGGFTYGKNLDNVFKDGKDIADYASDVTWEIAKKLDIGLDVDAFDGKISLQVDYFNEHRSGIFMQRNSLPYYMGLRSNPYGNVGIIDNHGFDGSLTWNGNVGKFRYQVIGNLTWNRNKVIENDQPQYKYPWMERKGKKVGQTFGYVALGLFESQREIDNSPRQNGDVRPGDIKFKDINGDGKIDDYDKVAIGYGDIPEVTYGIGFTFSYGAFSLSGLFQGIGNVDILLSGQGLQPFQQGLSSGNLLSNIEDRWTPENPNPHAFYPRLSPGTLNDDYVSSTWWLKNGRYLRLKNIQLSYTLPQSFINNIHIDNAYFFLQGVNVLTFAPFKLYDVELGDGRGNSYPNVKTFAAGFGFSF